ncbi:MAG: MFS transporter [Chloroflexota bacterium]
MPNARSWNPAIAFAALQNRDFRWFWLGRLASSATMEMGTVAQGWLVYSLTGSALAIGWVTAGSSIARIVFSLYGGALADRLDKRKLLLYTRTGNVTIALTLAILIITGQVRIWHLVAYSALSGVLGSLMMPAQTAMLSHLVAPSQLMNAISLTSVGQGLMGMLGATLAGVAIDVMGVDSVYFFIAGLYVLAIFAVSHLPSTAKSGTQQSPLWNDLREGVRYLRRAPGVVPLLGVALVRVLLGWSYRTLMPVYARDVMQMGGTGLGVLSAAPGAGSMVSSFVLATLGNYKAKGKLMLASGAVFGLALVAFANMRWFGAALVFLAVAGVCRNIGMVTNQTLLQMSSDIAHRGRVMSMYMTIMGLNTLGTIPAGALADAYSVQAAIMLYGVLMVLIYGALWLRRSPLREMT